MSLKFLPHRAAAFTLVEIMVVVAVITMLVAIAAQAFIRARQQTQATRIRDDLRIIDGAVDQYAMETQKQAGDPVAVSDWTNYVKKETRLAATGEDVLGHAYGPQTVDKMPVVPAQSYLDLQNVADDEFWKPYNP